MSIDPSTCDLAPGSAVRVLLFDDDPAAREIVREMLESSETAETWTLDWAPRTEEGLKALRERLYHVCLVDYRLLGWTGPEVIRLVRETDPAIPCVLLTGSTSREVDLEAMDAGASAFLSKDELDPRTLERTLRYALDGARQRASLVRLARRDPLTGLPNRAAVQERIGQALERSDRHPGALVGVAAIDLDGFKAVNDRLGHSAGDHVLRVVARRLEEAVRAYDTVARMGGDEFVVVLDRLRSVEEAEALAERLVAAVGAELDIDASITASVGVALHDGREQAEGLLARADEAMYAAKRRGKNQYRVEGRAQGRAAVPASDSDVREALHAGALQLVFQPQVDLETGDVEGFEALVRFQTPSGASMATSDLICGLEKSGGISELDRWVIAEAPRLAPTGSKLSINLSPKSLHCSSFVERLPPPAGWIELELTEGALAEDEDELVRRADALRTLGYRLAIDDFGVGYSSLARFAKLQVETLKIDRSFVTGIRAHRSRSVIQALARLAELENLRLVAEGIEHAYEGSALRSLGIRWGQGFLLGRPMPPERLRAWLDSRRLRTA